MQVTEGDWKLTRADQIGHWVEGLSVADDLQSASALRSDATVPSQYTDSDFSGKNDPAFVQGYLGLPSDWNLPQPGIIVSVTGSATAEFDLQEEVWYHRSLSGEESGLCRDFFSTNFFD